MRLVTAWSPVFCLSLCLSLVEAKFYRPFQFHQYAQGKPTSRHNFCPLSYRNHCAYVTEKTVSFTVQDGAAPYVKAEYNKCSWGQKCPALMYRLMYKPIYKVAHKTVTELEWRCCPGYSGYGCMEGPPVYQHPMKIMPPFKGPPMKGVQSKGPPYKGPMFKGPMFKGPPIHTPMKGTPWGQPQGPAPGGFISNPMPHFGPPSSSTSYPENSFESFSPESEPEPMPEHLEPHDTEEDHEHQLQPSQQPEEQLLEETPAPSSGSEQPEAENIGRTLDRETEERIFRIEEEVGRLNQGLDTLRETVNGLEDSLRTSLREDANRMLSALLSAAPGPVPAPPVASSLSTVGFGEIPGGSEETVGVDGRQVFTGFTELIESVEELRAEVEARTTELQELKETVTGHDRQLKTMSNSFAVVDSELNGNVTEVSIEELVDSKMNTVRAGILDGFEKPVETTESRCEDKAGDVRRQCQREQGEIQEQIGDSLRGSTEDLRTDLRNLQTQISDLKANNISCEWVSGLLDRVEQLETSVAGLNQSQRHLRVELGGHKDHIEGILEGRLGYVEDKLNLTGQMKSYETERKSEELTDQGLEAKMEIKIRALEGRILTALEGLGNATAPALLEGHAVPTLETELDSIRERLEVDVDRVQKQLTNLELRCSSSCSSTESPSIVQGDSAEPSAVLAGELNTKDVLDLQDDRLNTLNVTLQNILQRLSQKDQLEEAQGPPVQGEITILRFNVRSVNRTLKGLQTSLGTVINQIGQANNSWHERESRLAQQIKGVVQLVGHQASMLGAGERRLTRLRGELIEMKRRLAEEVRGCRSTAMGVQKEVSEVNGRVATVEDQCKGLNYLADDLERIREELEKQSSGLLLQVNGTLSSHAQQLSELKGELRNCTEKPEPTLQGFELEAAPRRGDTFTLD
ncbi:EMILIN-3-like [Cynoglossus semilaevis]|uniref:EMILIN-3-like n=1 Tax=Cynoglossus semilaevis TaxID=244447 RepID=UPI000D627F34|nr:EMILIN-3-like [Cynoglossus semilaevis]